MTGRSTSASSMPGRRMGSPGCGALESGRPPGTGDVESTASSSSLDFQARVPGGGSEDSKPSSRTSAVGTPLVNQRWSWRKYGSPNQPSASTSWTLLRNAAAQRAPATIRYQAARPLPESKQRVVPGSPRSRKPLLAGPLIGRSVHDLRHDRASSSVVEDGPADRVAPNLIF